jgi:hypothetical protein
VAVSEDLIYTSILELSRDVTAMRVELTGFVNTTNAIKADVSELKREIHQMKATDAHRKSFVGGIIAVTSVISSGFMVFIWPYIKEKLGL